VVPAAPTEPDGTAFAEDGIEEDEAKDATDVKKDDAEDDGDDDGGHNEQCELSYARGIEMPKKRRKRLERRAAALRLIGKIKAAEVASAAVNFGGEESDEGEAKPLAKTERAKELVACVPDRRLDAVDGRDRQGITSRVPAKVSRGVRGRQIERDSGLIARGKDFKPQRARRAERKAGAKTSGWWW